MAGGGCTPVLCEKLPVAAVRWVCPLPAKPDAVRAKWQPALQLQECQHEQPCPSGVSPRLSTALVVARKA